MKHKRWKRKSNSYYAGQQSRNVLGHIKANMRTLDRFYRLRFGR